ncbi:MAG: cryptochrome/photolyase family protein, partial [Gammaproteobacteria bacterium]
DDHPALHDAAEDGPVEAVFLLAERQWRRHDMGANRIGFLLLNLRALAEALFMLGIPLHVLPAPAFRDAPRVLLDLAARIGATHLAFNEEYPLDERVRDSTVMNAFSAAGRVVRMHPGSAILGPGTVLTGAGEPYTVFTPFRRRWLATLDRSAVKPLPAPRQQPWPTAEPPSDGPMLTGVPTTAAGVPIDGLTVLADWPAGAAAASARLSTFVADRITRYDRDRDRPAIAGTSALSPYLTVGALSARTCLHAAIEANNGRLDSGNPGVDTWISELVWRDFYRHVIAQFPHVSRGEAFRPEADQVRWRDAPDDFAAWCAGRTGYPLVDAAMRQLKTTGWMHNRLRMVTAMFLTKHLLIDWRAGERYFMQQLVDGDFAANNGGWQWSASTGTDAAPYFRIFNPVTQATRFDPDGAFVRAFVPELAAVSGRAIFEPARHGVRGYPAPIVDHALARARALTAFAAARA